MRVLIVDDDVVSRMVLMHLIDGVSATGERLELLEAEDGEDAWRQLEGGAAPALLFCDLRMPRLSGMELLARVKSDPRFDNLRFVLASAAGDADTMEQALGLGADGYVVKPFDNDVVRSHLACIGTEDETPAAACQRLGIDNERFLLYLGGLKRQLEESRPELARLLEADALDAVRTRLVRLADGCRTLGMRGAAAGLDASQSRPRADCVTRALDGAIAAVLVRTGSTRGPAN